MGTRKHHKISHELLQLISKDSRVVNWLSILQRQTNDELPEVIDSNFNESQNALAQAQNTLNNRINVTNNTIDSVSLRVMANETTINELEQASIVNSMRLTAVESDITNINQSITNIQSDVANNATAISNIQNSITDIENRLTTAGI